MAAKYNACFRELDLAAFAALEHPLLVVAAEPRKRVQIGPHELLFLLEDLVKKLVHVFAPAKPNRFATDTASRQPEFDRLDRLSPDQAAAWAVSLLPQLLHHLEAVASYFQQFEKADADADFDSTKHAAMVALFAALLAALHALLSWSKLTAADGKQTVAAILRALAGRVSETPSQLVQDCAREALVYLVNVAKVAPTSQVLAQVLQLLCRIKELPHEEPRATFAKKISTLCDRALRKRWSGDARRPIKPEHLAVLLRVLFENAADVVEAVEVFALTALPELVAVSEEGEDDDAEGEAADKEEGDAADGKKAKAGKKRARKAESAGLVAASCPTLTKATFVVFYKALLDALAAQVAQAGVELLQAGEDVRPSMVDAQLAAQQRTAKLFATVVKFTQDPRLGTKPAVMATLKAGRGFVGEIIRVAFPVVERHFRDFPEQSVALVKLWQQTTRFLSNMCSHVKTHDAALAAHAPPLKKLLETFVFRTKSMMAANSCGEAFALGMQKLK